MKRFTGKVIIVTGAASGIGEACLHRLYEEGAYLVAVDLDAAVIEKKVAGIGDSKRVVGLGADISNRHQVAELFSHARNRFGDLYGLVNSAGIRGVGNILDFDPGSWDRVLAVNLTGTFNVCQQFARAVKTAGTAGAIVTVSSAAGLMGNPNRLAYAASKFGVSGITRTMAAELGAFNIRVNGVAPGMIRTPMTAPMFVDPENVKKIRATHPIGREGEAREVAAAIAFLLSDDASFITGAVLPVDGGVTAVIPSY